MIYELRTYDAHPGKLDDLSRRFADHTLTLFHRHGIKSVGYWTDAKDAASNRLTYLLAFESEEQYKAAGRRSSQTPTGRRSARRPRRTARWSRR